MIAVERVQFPNQPVILAEDELAIEIFADDLAGLNQVNGNVVLTFAKVRTNHSKNPPMNYRKVSGRLVMPLSSLVGMQQALAEIVKDMERQGMIQKPPPNLHQVQ